MATPGEKLPVRPVRNFSPDLDSLTPGVIIDSNDVYPTTRGMRNLPDVLQLTNALPDTCLGAAVFQFSAAPRQDVIVAGTARELLVQTTGGFTVQATTPPDAITWNFAFYEDGNFDANGNPIEAIIAVNGTDKPWVMTLASLSTATPWSKLSADVNTPISQLVASSDFSLFLVEPNSATWHSSVNPQIWTDDVATETVSATLTQTPGNITAILALRSNMVIYKERSVFLGSLVGPPLIWQFTEISRQHGTPGARTVVSVGDFHYFLGVDDFYVFDGFSITRLPNMFREWFFNRVFRFEDVQARYDEIRSCVFWHFHTKQVTSALDQWIALNIRTGQWSKGEKAVEQVLNGTIVSTPQKTCGFVSAGDTRLQAHTIYGYEPDGIGLSTSSITTGDLGDRHFMFQVTRVRPHYSRLNGLPTLTPLNLYVSGGKWNAANGRFEDNDAAPYTSGVAVPLSADGWFNLNNSARLQRLRIDHDADCELMGLEIDLKPVGEV